MISRFYSIVIASAFMLMLAVAVNAGPAVPMEGQWAEIGKVYNIGSTSLIAFSLKSAEYVAGRVKVGESFFVPKIDEKFLVLHFTLQNPGKEMFYVNWDTVHFTVVDSSNTNREYNEYIGLEKNKEPMDLELKPAQKVEAYAIVKMGAKESAPKLIVQALDGGGVLRYDMRDKVKGLPAPFADPKDKTGCKILKEVPAKQGVYYPGYIFDFRLDKVEYSNDQLLDWELEEGNKYAIFTFSVKNQSAEPMVFEWWMLIPKLRAMNGQRVEWNDTILHAIENEQADVEIEPGQEVQLRYAFAIKESTTAKSLQMQENQDEEEGRRYLYSFAEEKKTEDAEAEESSDEETPEEPESEE